MILEWLGIRKGEGRIVLQLGTHGFLCTGAAVCLSTAAEGLFIGSYPAAWLPYVFLGGALLTLAVSAGYDRIQTRLTPEALATVVGIGLAVSLMLLRGLAAFAPKLGPFALFLVAPSTGTLLSMETSGLLARSLDPRSARRLLPTVGVFCSLGAMTAGLIVGFLSPVIGVPEMTWLSVGFILSSLLLIRKGKGSVESRPPARPVPWSGVARHSFALLLILIVFTSIASSTLARFQLGACVKESLSKEQIASFLGFLRAGLNGGGVLFQLLLVRWLISRLGVGAGFVATPGIVLGAALAAIAFPQLATITTLVFLGTLLRQNLQRPISYLAVMPIPEDVRARASLAVRGALDAPATAVACAVLMVGSSFLTWQSTSYAVATLSGIAVVCAWRSRKEYSREVGNALRARRLRSSEEEDPHAMLDGEMRQQLEQELRSSDPEQVTLALHLLEDRFTEESLEVVRERWHHWPPELKGVAAEVLAHESMPEAAEFLRGRAPEETESVRAVLLRQGVLTPSDAELGEWMERGGWEERAQAMVTLIHRTGLPSVRELLEAWIHSADLDRKRSAAVVIGHTEDPTLWSRMHALAEAVPIEVARAVERHPSPEFAEFCVRSLLAEEASSPAREALRKMGAAARPSLMRAARDEALSGQTLRLLGEFDDPETRSFLFSLLFDTDDEIRYRATKALARRPAETEEERHEVREAIEAELSRCRRYRAASKDGPPVFRAEAAESFDWSLERALRLLSLLQPQLPFRRIYLAFIHGDSSQKSMALEALDEMVGKEWRANILAALESDHLEPVPDRSTDRWETRMRRAVQEEAGDPELQDALRLKQIPLFAPWRLRDLEAVVTQSRGRARSEGKWLVVRQGGDVLGIEHAVLDRGEAVPQHEAGLAITMDAIDRTISERPRCGAAWLQGLAAHLAPRFVEPAPPKRRRPVGRFDTGVTQVKRVFSLRSVPLLASIPAPRLSLLAEIAHPVRFEAGEAVVVEGEHGDRFYMISTGRLEVLREGKRLAILAGGDAFGELALLRGERRNATVRALEPCELLAIDQVDFLDLLYTHPSLVPPFARLVTHRLLELRRKG